MTDGTSQGLFIVVAIVIFGIFTLLAYILFEDTLSPALASMFGEATEQATKQLNKSIISIRDFELKVPDNDNHRDFYEIKGNKIIFKAEYPVSKAMWLSKDFFEPNQEYVLTFDYRVTSGRINHLAGHLAISEGSKVYVDNKLMDGDWHNPYLEAPSFPQDHDTHTVRLEFNTNYYQQPYNSDNGELIPTGDGKLYIQPNRYSGSGLYGLEIWNVRLEKK